MVTLLKIQLSGSIRQYALARSPQMQIGAKHSGLASVAEIEELGNLIRAQNHTGL